MSYCSDIINAVAKLTKRVDISQQESNRFIIVPSLSEKDNLVNRGKIEITFSKYEDRDCINVVLEKIHSKGCEKKYTIFINDRKNKELCKRIASIVSDYFTKVCCKRDKLTKIEHAISVSRLRIPKSNFLIKR